MRTGGRGLLIGLAKLVAVVVAGVAVGAGVGYGLSVVSGENGSADTSAAAPATSTPTAAPSPTPTPEPAKVKKARVAVLDAAFEPATSTLTLQVRARNVGTQVIQSRHPAVVLPAGAAEADPAATADAGALLKPIEPGHKATGSLRFLTSGEVTTQLAAGTPAKLSMFHRQVPVPAAG